MSWKSVSEVLDEIMGSLPRKEGGEPFRWVCENCEHVNETTLAYYREKAEAVGEDHVWYGDTCEVCARGVGDVREQPKPESR